MVQVILIAIYENDPNRPPLIRDYESKEMASIVGAEWLRDGVHHGARIAQIVTITMYIDRSKMFTECFTEPQLILQWGVRTWD